MPDTTEPTPPPAAPALDRPSRRRSASSTPDAMRMFFASSLAEPAAGAAAGEGDEHAPEAARALPPGDAPMSASAAPAREAAPQPDLAAVREAAGPPGAEPERAAPRRPRLGTSGRPTKHQGVKVGRTAVLLRESDLDVLDRVAGETFARTGEEANRSELLRALVEAVAVADVAGELAECATHRARVAFLADRLRVGRPTRAS